MTKSVTHMGMSNVTKVITILLAAYNGEKYISQQIDSLLNQTFQNFIIYICDDNSSDSTNAIITEYARNHPEKIFISKNSENSGGAKNVFFQMIIAHKGDYVMLCDHDDVWLPDKIEVTYNKMIQMEAAYGFSTPLLVHTDLKVVDENLNTISESFKAAMNADFSKTSLRNQIIQNTLTGCTAMYNRALADLISVVPSFAVMHDWWLMLTVSAFGQIGTVEQQTILYRQHGKNEIGAKDVRTLKYKLNKLMHYEEIRKALNDTYLQAQSFLEVFKSKLTPDQIDFLTVYCDIPNHIKPVRWIMICRLGVLKNGISRKIANFIFI